MARVRIEPAGLSLDLEDGETLFDAAMRAGWSWPTICLGDGVCLTCWVEIFQGEEHANAVEEIERKGLEALSARRMLAAMNSSTLRLACQLRFSGDALVQRRGPKPPE
jgi:2Fe-2S ferredoxin